MNEIIIVSLLIGLIFAPLGCVVVWKRYVYFGDGLAHASILAGVMSVIFNIPLFYAGISIAIFFAAIIFKFRLSSGKSAAIGLVSSSMMSLALVINAVYPGSASIFTLLFGDIISVTYEDIPGLLILLAAVILFMITSYRNIILMVFNRDIAFSRGINVNILEFCFLTLLSFAILYTIKIVGALLVTSIIIIPAMCGRLIAPTPLVMIIAAIIYVTIMNIAGVFLSLKTDLPFAPLIVLCGGGLFIITFMLVRAGKFLRVVSPKIYSESH